MIPGSPQPGQAAGGWRLVGAVMAARDVALAVVDQAHVAALAAQHEPAARATDVRVEAAAVEEKDHLLALRERAFHRQAEPARDQRRQPFFAQLGREIEDLDRRQRPSLDAARERQQFVLPCARIVEAFERRRGGAEDDERVFLPRAPDANVAAVKARGFRLFEGGVVFLVHDEQAELRHGGEDGGARADDDVGPAFVDRRPLRAAVGIGHVAVQHADAVEPRAEPRHGLRRQRDLRHEDDALPARLDAEAQRPQIDFRLAAAGDAVKQRHVEPAAARTPPGSGRAPPAARASGPAARCARRETPGSDRARLFLSAGSGSRPRRASRGRRRPSRRWRPVCLRRFRLRRRRARGACAPAAARASRSARRARAVRPRGGRRKPTGSSSPRRRS